MQIDMKIPVGFLCSLITVIWNVIVTAAKMHASRSQQNHTTLQHEQQSADK
jgi:hypothetical protein